MYVGGGNLNEIKYIAAYHTSPVSAVTYYAEVDSIEAYGDGGKDKFNFKSTAKPIDPIAFADVKPISLQGSRYKSYAKLLKTKPVKDLFD